MLQKKLNLTLNFWIETKKKLNNISTTKKFLVTYSFSGEACSSTQLCKPSTGLTCDSTTCKCLTVNTYWDSTSKSCRKEYFLK